MNHVNRETGGALDALDLRDPQSSAAIARLRMECASAKEALSTTTETAIPVFLPHQHLEVAITRAQFEDLARADIESTTTALAGTLRSARVAPADLSAVLLVGGSSQIPLVARTVSEQFGRPVVSDVDPKKAVALGAAALADGRARPVETPETGLPTRNAGATTRCRTLRSSRPPPRVRLLDRRGACRGPRHSIPRAGADTGCRHRVDDVVPASPTGAAPAGPGSDAGPGERGEQ